MADLIPITAWIDGELVNQAKFYLKFSTPVNNLNNQVQSGQIGDTGPLFPALLNSWVSYDSGVTEAVPQYRKLNGVVYLGGAGKNGTVGTIFVLPAGFRPLKNRIWNVGSASAFSAPARVDVGPTGVVQLVIYGAGGSNAGLSLDGISFPAEQ